MANSENGLKESVERSTSLCVKLKHKMCPINAAAKAVVKTLIQKGLNQLKPQKDFQYDKNADKCYKLQTVNNEWHEGYDKCREKFASNYANIRNEVEMKAVMDLIRKKNQNKGVWIGLSDFFTPGMLTWSRNQGKR